MNKYVIIDTSFDVFSVYTEAEYNYIMNCKDKLKEMNLMLFKFFNNWYTYEDWESFCMDDVYEYLMDWVKITEDEIKVFKKFWFMDNDVSWDNYFHDIIKMWLKFLKILESGNFDRNTYY